MFLKKGQSDDKELQGRAEQNALMPLAFGVIGFALGCVGYGAVFGIIGIGFGVLGLKSKGKKKLFFGFLSLYINNYRGM